MISREKALALRKLIEKLSADLPDSEAYTAPELFPKWKLQDFEKGDRRQYDGILYECLQKHTAQADWTPDKAVSLWKRVEDPAIEFPDWRQPTGAHDAYAMGAKVSHNEKHWQSDIDANVYEPGVYGWSEV